MFKVKFPEPGKVFSLGWIFLDFNNYTPVICPNNKITIVLSTFALALGASRHDSFLVSMIHPYFSPDKMSHFSKLSQYLHFLMYRNTSPQEHGLHPQIHQGKPQEHLTRQVIPLSQLLQDEFWQ